MRCTEPTEIPMALAIPRPVQWVASCGGWVQVSATTCAATSSAIGALPCLRVLSRNRPPTPPLGKALLPPPHRWPADPNALCHPLCRVPLRRGEHDARPLDVLTRPVAIGGNRCQLLVLGGAQYHTYPLCHGPHSPTRHGPISHIFTRW